MHRAPFDVAQLRSAIDGLAARIASVESKTNAPPPAAPEEMVQVGIFELHPARRLLKKSGKEIRLTPTEFDLIAYLMGHAGHPVLHAKLLSSVWGPQYGDEREYLRTFIMQLRKKLEDDPASPVYLKTVNYLGYLFSDLKQQTAQRE